MNRDSCPLSEHDRQLGVAALADAQRGAIARAQLRDCGLSEAAISRQIAAGRLHPKWPGVSAVGHPTLTREGWWWAAVLAAGPEPSSRVAPPRRRGGSCRLSTIDVVVPGDAGASLRGVRAHGRASSSEVTAYLGLPVTTIARTALDVAAWDRPERVPELLDRPSSRAGTTTTRCSPSSPGTRGTEGWRCCERTSSSSATTSRAFAHARSGALAT